MPKIFLSYRREDSAYPTHQIYSELRNHFGSDAIVYDIDTIPLGTDFRQFLNDAVSSCDIMLAIIGDQWTEILNNRQEIPNDFIRTEIAIALERQIPVVPVLVGKASMPTEKSLPPELSELAYRQAAEVRSGINLDAHLNRLIARLDSLMPALEAAKSQTIQESPRQLNQEQKEHHQQPRSALEPPFQRISPSSKRKRMLTFGAAILVITFISLTLLLFPKTPKTPGLVPLFADTFDNTKYDGSLNLEKWAVHAEKESNQMSNVQENGLLHSTLKPIESYDNEVISRERWKIDQIKRVEWRIKVENAVRGKWASLAVGLKSTDEHWLTCDFIVNEENPKMQCFSWGSGNEDIYAENIPIHLDTWHILRLDIVKDPLAFTFYLDGEKISSSPVKDTKAWKNKYVQVYSNLGATDSKDTLISYIDYVYMFRR